jgi:predicted nucleotide-binding protein (sugar kinase/HSP70/actin superfamily)
MVESKKRNSLEGRTLHIPRMSYAGARAIASAFKSIGIDATITPDSNDRTMELGGRFTSGDECLPQKVTLGDFLRIAESPGFDPKKAAFFMPTSGGPCRFGQYAPLLRHILDERGLEDVEILSPTSADGYSGLGEQASEFIRTGWRALLAGDVLTKLLLKTRPYELNEGETDRVFEESLGRVSAALEAKKIPQGEKLKNVVAELVRARDKFRAIPADYSQEKLLIGMVGEIFCRLNDFSNEDTIRKIEKLGGQVWLSDVAEWVWYTKAEQKRNLRLVGRGFSLEMLGAKIKNYFQRKDEEAILEPFKEDFKGLEEPHDITEVLEMGSPYLPCDGALGEMVLSVGKSLYLYEKGADGIIDISPFTCMNGIVCEAVYPVLSREHDGIPVKVFYFDGTQSDVENDIEIFLELAKNYRRKKKKARTFSDPSIYKATLAAV